MLNFKESTTISNTCKISGTLLKHHACVIETWRKTTEDLGVTSTQGLNLHCKECKERQITAIGNRCSNIKTKRKKLKNKQTNKQTSYQKWEKNKIH